MPIYEYGCQKCGHEFEELVFGSANPACPKCGSNDVEKLMSKCCHTGADGSSYDAGSAGGGSSCGCSGCAGGNCSSCGH